MLLTISTNHRPATDLGYLLHKHPDRVQRFSESFGTAVVCYPEASEQRCTVALLLDVDPVTLARRRKSSPDFSLAQYVNDRPYAASSLLAAALAHVFSTARTGRCAARQDLADRALPLDIDIPVLPCRGGPDIARRVFEPLGWQVRADPIALDPAFPEWGESRYVSLRLSGRVRLADALNHLYVLLPVLDESKHYWQGPDEVDKLLRAGAGWLADHPDVDVITRRYLRRATGLAQIALRRLAELGESVDDLDDPIDGTAGTSGETSARSRIPLNVQRQQRVHEAITELGATSVIDLGCGPGQLLARLVTDPRLTKIAGTDVSVRALQLAAGRLHLDELHDRARERLELFQSALTYRDERFRGYDAAVLMEVIEHVDPGRLPALEEAVFGLAHPGSVIVTTPNSEYNATYEHLQGLRHPDHRFEWTRELFADWCAGVAERHGYRVTQHGIGPEDARFGAPTQLAIFTAQDRGLGKESDD